MMENEKKNAFEAYNIIADWFSKSHDHGLVEKSYLDKVIDIIGENARVLDLGCGTGMPIMKYLIDQGMQVIGVDASYRMLEIARRNLPSGNFIQTDMRQLSLGQKFDAIIAWNSFFHLPPEDQSSMIGIFKSHLNNNGILLFTSGKEHGEAWGMNGGVNLYHGSLSTQEYRSLLEANNFRVLEYKEDDPDCGMATVWMLQSAE